MSKSTFQIGHSKHRTFGPGVNLQKNAAKRLATPTVAVQTMMPEAESRLWGYLDSIYADELPERAIALLRMVQAALTAGGKPDTSQLSLLLTVAMSDIEHIARDVESLVLELSGIDS